MESLTMSITPPPCLSLSFLNTDYPVPTSSPLYMASLRKVSVTAITSKLKQCRRAWRSSDLFTTLRAFSRQNFRVPIHLDCRFNFVTKALAHRFQHARIGFVPSSNTIITTHMCTMADGNLSRRREHRQLRVYFHDSSKQ